MTPPLLQRVEKLGHRIFTEGSYNINFIGVRTEAKDAGKFDDWLTMWYRDTDGSWQSHWWPATTDPGLYWLHNPMRTEGTAIVVPGQYPKLWKIGAHKGYKAFQQVGNVKVYRDRDRDDELDFSPESIQEGMFYINGHASDPNPWDKHDKSREGGDVNKWSAGCQVFANSADFRLAIRLAEQSMGLGFGNTLTYTLVEERDVFVP